MAESVELADAGTRAAIAELLDETLFVEAGAGTGKTTTLVSRVLGLVRREKTTIDAIAAITFTEAAAADLRSRIHLELTKAAREADGDWARHALGALDDASMTTIHGFAHRILAEHPLAAGLPLRFRVRDEIEYDLDLERRFRGTVEGLVADDDRGQLLAAALAIGIKIGQLSELAEEVDSKWDRLERSAQEEIAIVPIAEAVDAAEAEIAAAIESVLPLRAACTDESDALAVQLDVLEEALQRRATSEDWIDRLGWCCSLRKIVSTHCGRKRAWKGLPIAEVRVIIGDLEARRAEIKARIVGEVLDALVVVFAREALAAAQARREAGELSFHDLLVLAHRLLRSHPEVTRQVSERYSHILVDEFQDTDPLQLEIVTDLAKDADGVELVPGKLFFVGDPRQSIYRFRGAEPELYERALARIVPSGPLGLTSNFRSVAPILRWVNALFGRLFSGDDGAPRHQPLSVVRGDDLAGTVNVCGAESEDRLSAHERRVREAADIAALVDRCVRDGWPVGDDGEVRPARWSDIVILVTRRSGLAELEDALDGRDIPFRADSPSLILRSTEVRDFLACLRAIDAPGDDTALVSALRTPLLACGDDDLWRFRRSGGRWSLEAAESDAGEPVERALSRLRGLAMRRDALGLLGTVHAAAEELKVFELAATTRHGEESLRRLLYLFARASAFVDAGGRSIASFADWIERQAGSRVRGLEAAIADDDGAVRILTVHAAKGLEFPVVLLAELASDPARQRAAGRILFDGEGRPEVRIRLGVETPGYAELYGEEEERADDELVRLLYVAMTRARDHLVVSLHRPRSVAKSRPSLADRVGDLLDELDGLYEVAELAVLPQEGRAAIGSPFDGPAATKSAFAQWRSSRDALSRACALPTSVGARALESGGVGVPRRQATPAEDADAPPDGEDWRSPRGATAIGRAVHAVLQRVGLRDGAGLLELVVSESLRAGCADAHETVRSLVAAALASDELRRAAAAERCWRELPISVPVGDGVLDGVIDLAYETDLGGLVVVDYKTDSLADEEELRLRYAAYRTQAGAYAYALQRVLGRPIARFTFLFLNGPDGVRALDVEDLDVVAAEAVEAAEHYLQAPVR